MLPIMRCNARPKRIKPTTISVAAIPNGLITAQKENSTIAKLVEIAQINMFINMDISYHIFIYNSSRFQNTALLSHKVIHRHFLDTV